MKRILIALSEWGYWGEELVRPLALFDERGYESTFITAKGRRPPVISVSMDPTYEDPPLGRPVTSEATAQRVREVEQSGRLDHPRSLAEVFPRRPYLSSPDYVAALEAYYDRRAAASEFVAPYDALLLVGGSGPIMDMANNQRYHDLVLAFFERDKPIAAECYAVTCLAFARDVEDRVSLLQGRHVTGHPLEFDYQEGWGVVAEDGYWEFGAPPYPLEYILRDAVGPKGRFHGNVGKRTSVIVDYPFITSRSVASSTLCGELLVRVLEENLRRFGW